MTAMEHALRGTYVPSRHGPLPPGVVPAPRRPALVARGERVPATARPLVAPPPTPAPVATLTEADCPDVLSPEGRAIWVALVTQRPTDKVLGAFVAMYVEASLVWRRATVALAQPFGTKRVAGAPTSSQYLKIRRDAEATMFRVAGILGWDARAAGPVFPVQEPPKSRLELFLAARS